jgi:glutathione transport system substrate-binding protein
MSLRIRKIITLLIAASILALGSASAQSQLRILQTEAPRSMDPADQTATYTGAVLYPMYEGLVDPAPDGIPTPALAASWEINDTGDVWTFTLQEGVVFHDGTPLTAEAVQRSFARLLVPENGLAGAGRFQTVIDSVAVTADDRVQFNLFTSYPAFLALLTGSQAGVVQVDAWEAGTLGRAAVGTGPYRFVEWDSGEHVTMEAFADYWRELPQVERLVWTWSPEAAVMTMALQAGEVDIVNPLPPVYAQPLDMNPEIDVLQTDGSAVFWVSLNVELAPLDDVRVRQALNYATNREGIVNALLQGYGSAANSPLSPANFGYDPATPGYEFNIAKAKELLTEAGHPDGIAINLAVQEADSNTAEALQGMWAEAGIRLNVQLMEGGVWSDLAFAEPERKAENAVHSVFASWSTSSLDADGQLRSLYHTANWAPGSANLGFYSNARVDELLDAGVATTNTAERLEIYSEAQFIINDEAAHVLLYYPKALAAKGSSVSGVWLSPGSQIMVRWPVID